MSPNQSEIQSPNPHAALMRQLSRRPSSITSTSTSCGTDTNLESTAFKTLPSSRHRTRIRGDKTWSIFSPLLVECQVTMCCVCAVQGHVSVLTCSRQVETQAQAQAQAQGHVSVFLDCWPFSSSRTPSSSTSTSHTPSPSSLSSSSFFFCSDLHSRLHRRLHPYPHFPLLLHRASHSTARSSSSLSPSQSYVFFPSSLLYFRPSPHIGVFLYNGVFPQSIIQSRPIQSSNLSHPLPLCFVSLSTGFFHMPYDVFFPPLSLKSSISSVSSTSNMSATNLSSNLFGKSFTHGHRAFFHV